MQCGGLLVETQDKVGMIHVDDADDTHAPVVFVEPVPA
jgi:hypothetical protein